MEAKQAYLLQLYRALRWTSTKKWILPVLAEYQTSLAALEDPRTPAQALGAPTTVADKIRPNWSEPWVRRCYWSKVLLCCLLMGAAVSLFCFLYGQYRSASLPLLFLVLSVAAPLLSGLLWMIADQGVLASAVFSKEGERRTCRFWQMGILLVAAAEQLVILYGPALLLKWDITAWGGAMQNISQWFVGISAVFLLLALYRYTGKGEAHMLGIVAQSLGMLFSALLLQFYLFSLVEPWVYFGFPILPYYVALAVALVHDLFVRRSRSVTEQRR